jgi:apolipoprotein N-acyltransferase
MNRIFLGKPWHWMMLAALFAVLWWMGSDQLQTKDYTLFLTVLIGMTAALVLAICVGYRHGERITRDPFDDDSA